MNPTDMNETELRARLKEIQEVDKPKVVAIQRYEEASKLQEEERAIMEILGITPPKKAPEPMLINTAGDRSAFTAIRHEETDLVCFLIDPDVRKVESVEWSFARAFQWFVKATGATWPDFYHTYDYIYKGGVDALFCSEIGTPFALSDESGTFTIHKGPSLLFPSAVTIAGPKVHQFGKDNGFFGRINGNGRVEWGGDQTNEPSIPEQK